MQQYSKYSHRLLTLIVIFVLAFSIIAIRLVLVSLPIEKDILKNKINSNNTRERPLIIDKNGVKLAVNLHTASLYTNPRKIKNKEAAASFLHEIFSDISYDTIYRKLSSQNSFVWIKRHITPNEQYAVNSLGLPELQFQNDKSRIYTLGSLFAHIIGYVDTDNNGLAGLEYYIDKQQLQDTLALSLDSRVQSIVEEQLRKSIQQYKALGAAGIVLDANNGEILAMSSLPNFDPHRLNNATKNQIYNRATLGVYEFGSILKIFTLAAALDLNLIDVETKYNVSKPLKIGKHTIKDFHSHPTSELTVRKIFTRSSNVGMVHIGMLLKGNLQKEYFNNMGLLGLLDVEIPEKSSTIAKDFWTHSTTASVSYGYGIAPTLLHIAQATASIVNGGKLYPATLILNSNNQHKYTRSIKEETSEKMRDLMREVVINGTGRRARTYGYDVGGKTGSAEKSINGIYMKSANISSFIAAFPISLPKYVIAIMIDEPQPGPESKFVTGGIVAAPIVKEIVSRIAPILNILPEE